MSFRGDRPFRIKLLTHTDFDGVGCYLVMSEMLPDKTELDVEFLDYHNVDEYIKNFVLSGEFEEYDSIFITDISVNEEVAGLLDTHVYRVSNDIHLTLLDHHVNEATEHLNKFDYWALETTKTMYDLDFNGYDNSTACGTRHVLENFMMASTQYDANPLMLDFVELVRAYDTWDWDKYGIERAYDFALCLDLVGRDKFIEIIQDGFRNYDRTGKFYLPEMEQYLVDFEKKRIAEMIDELADELIVKFVDGKQFGVVICNKYKSEAGNKLAKRFPELDGIMLISPKTTGGGVSVRGIHDIHLGNFVNFNYNRADRRAGGHPKAAGFGILPKHTEQFINNVLEV